MVICEIQFPKETPGEENPRRWGIEEPKLPSSRKRKAEFMVQKGNAST